MQVFTIAPAGMKPLWILVPVILVVAVVLLVLTLSIMGSRTSRFEVSEAGLRVRGDLYGRFIPREQLRIEAARRVDLDRTEDLRPRLRTWGTGLPGYQSGWFRLRNGERALVYLTDRHKAVYVPTALGYSLLLSPDDPGAFLSALETVNR
jgi:hypothetical protein